MAEGELLVTLAISLAAAGIGAVIAAWLRQSVVLGYVAAGVFLGPGTPGFVADAASVEQLAEIGIVLIMFAIGVQLSMRELLRTGPVAVTGAVIQVLTIMAVGYGVGVALGWGSLESLIFGAVISNSSSTVISKLLTERGEGDSVHGRLSIAWSTVQDLGTVVMIVVFTALADENGGPIYAEIARAMLMAGLYFLLVIPVGVIVLPRVFGWVAQLGNREVFILAATAIAMGTAYAATIFGVSIALGAFVAGMVVARSDLSHQVLGEIAPQRDIFAAIFFVSVGMLLDPTVAAQNIDLVLLAAALTIFVKGALSAVLTIVGGYRARTGLLTGVLLGQSAEFSFLLATVGVSLNVLGEDLFGVLIAAAAISIVALPTLHRVARPAGNWVEEHLRMGRQRAEKQSPFPADRQGHAILCGGGRVGGIIERALRRNAIDYVVIDSDIHIVSDLRSKGVASMYGSASNPVLLEQAGLERARALIIAIPDPVSARQVVEHARRMNPAIDIVVRTHSDIERRTLQERGANEAVMGELELALEMSRHTLRRFGASDIEAADTVDSLRATL